MTVSNTVPSIGNLGNLVKTCHLPTGRRTAKQKQQVSYSKAKSVGLQASDCVQSKKLIYPGFESIPGIPVKK